MIMEIIFLIVLIAIGVLAFRFILDISSTLVKIAVHFLFG